MLWKSKDSEDVKELFEERAEFFVGNEVEVAVHKVQIQKVTNLIFFIQIVSRVVQNIFR